MAGNYEERGRRDIFRIRKETSDHRRRAVTVIMTLYSRMTVKIFIVLALEGGWVGSKF